MTSEKTIRRAVYPGSFDPFHLGHENIVRRAATLFDDLIIGVGSLRRRVRLASVLRRCTVADATLRGSELTVRFRPNPEVWPK